MTNFRKVASLHELVPVLGWRVMLEKSKPATMGGLEKKKGGRREGDVPAPLKVKLVGGRSTFYVAKGRSWGERPLAYLLAVRLNVVPLVRHDNTVPRFEPPVGIEPTTCRLQGGRSGHLS